MTTATSLLSRYNDRAEELVVDTDDSRLFVDDTYQRHEHRPLVNQIQHEGWDMVRAGFLYINERASGKWAIIDGQQRWRAARKVDEPELLAIMLHGMTIAEEAALYCALNDTGRKGLTQLEKFKGAYAGGKGAVWARAIVEIVASYNAGILGIDGFDGPRLRSIAAIRGIYDRGGDVELRAVLDIVRDAYSVISQDTTQSEFLRAIHMLITQHPQIDHQRLSDRIRRRDFIALKSQAAAAGRGSANARGFYNVIKAEYNERLGQERRLP